MTSILAAVTSIATAWAMVATLGAQPPTPAPQHTPDSQVTLTGCVERADQVTPTGATAASTVDSLDFVLIKATSGAVGTSGTAGAPEAASKATAAKTYRLDADKSTINPHVGHQVEVIGVVVEPGTQAAAGQPEAPASAPKLKVNSIKMLASTCPR